MTVMLGATDCGTKTLSGSQSEGQSLGFDPANIGGDVFSGGTTDGDATSVLKQGRFTDAW